MKKQGKEADKIRTDEELIRRLLSKVETYGVGGELRVRESSWHGGRYTRLDDLLKYYSERHGEPGSQYYQIPTLDEAISSEDTLKVSLMKQAQRQEEKPGFSRVLNIELVFPVGLVSYLFRELELRLLDDFAIEIKGKYEKPVFEKEERKYWFATHQFQSHEIDKRPPQRYGILRLPITVVDEDYDKTLEIYKKRVEIATETAKQLYNSLEGFEKWLRTIIESVYMLPKICAQMKNSEKISDLARGLAAPSLSLIKELIPKNEK